MGKIIIKGATQVSGHSLKFYFCMFEKSQRKQNSLDCHNNFLEYFSLIANFTFSKLDINKKCFCMFKTLKSWKWTILIFFKRPFFLPNVHHSFWKLERILTLMIRKGKWFELMKIFITHLSTFGSKVFLTPKIMDFENVA